MKNKTKESKNDYIECASCLGSKYIYDGHGDEYIACPVCKGKGKISQRENEVFLYSILQEK